MRFFGLTDVGRKRSDNEDRFAVSDEHQYAILADGMGGRSYGEVASSMTVDGLARCIEHEWPRSLDRLERGEQMAAITHLVDEWVRMVNGEVFARGEADERYREMGTTLVFLMHRLGQICLAHIGDSRCYRFAGGKLELLTEDHSLVASRVKQGEMTAEEARDSDQKNIITRAVGTAEKVKPEIHWHPVKSGDRLLLCSDGLTDMVDDDAISAILAEGASIEEATQQLVDAANEAGGRDNITAILVDHD